MRFDRLLTLYIFHSLKTLLPQKEFRLPILMYHSISDEPEQGHPYYWINTSPGLFVKHMQFLHDHGYDVIPLSTAVEMIKSGSEFITCSPEQATVFSTAQHSSVLNASISGIATRAPQPVTRNAKALLSQSTNNQSTGNPLSAFRYVVLTFDDGYRDFYTHASPVLKQFGFTATVFLPTDYIGNGRPGIRGKEHLSWEEVRELCTQGITFGSHTCSHPQLRDLGHDVLKDELARSYSAIETEAGACDGFCYPYKFPEQDGHFLSVLTDSIQSAGYHYGVSTRIGTTNKASDIFSLKRIPMNSWDDIPLFAAKLRGGYDWLASLQAVAKRMRRPASRRRSFKSNA